MADTHDVPFTRVGPEGGKPAAMLAQYETPADVLHAAEKFRDGGYSFFDTFTPFPIHGMDKAMGMRDSRLGWIVAVAALFGFTLAVSFQYWGNVESYPFVVGGKPPFSIPAYAPICFEVTVLFSSFAAVFGMLFLNRLPRHNHPLFESDRFRAATDDKFFLAVECADPKYSEARTRELFVLTRPTHIELVEESDS